MIRTILAATVVAAVCLPLAPSGQRRQEARGDDAIDFGRDVTPLIQRHCVRCHKPGNSKSDISLATADDLLEIEYIVPGKPGERLS